MINGFFNNSKKVYFMKTYPPFFILDTVLTTKNNKRIQIVRVKSPKIMVHLTETFGAHHK